MITGIHFSHYRQIAGWQRMELLHPAQKDRPAEPARASGIWGANGTGKSAIVDALEWIQTATSLRAVQRWPPRARSTTTNPAGVGIDLLQDGEIYRYTLEAEKEMFVREKLTRLANEDEGEEADETLFERTAEGLTIREGPKDQHETASLLKKIDPRVTIMVEAERLQNPICTAINRELQEMQFVRPLSNLEKSLRTTIDVCSTEGPVKSPAGIRRRIAAALLQNAGIRTGDLERGPVERLEEQIADAGEGGRRAAAIAGPAAVALTGQGFLTIDPIDAGIDGNWQRGLVECFNRQPRSGDRRAQLLFTTGSSDLIETLERDQVWLAEPGTHGTTIYSLSEFRENDMEKGARRKRYEVGRYGGITEPNPIPLQLACADAYAGQPKNANEPDKLRNILDG